MAETFLTEIDKEVEMNKIDCVFENTEGNVEYFVNISSKLVDAYTCDLTRLMDRIKYDIIDSEASDNQIEQHILELSNLLYYVGDKLESMGIKDDLSKIAAKEVYNNSYIERTQCEGKKPTVAELSALAEDDSRYENIVNMIYSRAYRQIKFKIDAAYEMLASLRKVLSKRMQDAQLAATRQPTMVPGVVLNNQEVF